MTGPRKVNTFPGGTDDTRLVSLVSPVWSKMCRRRHRMNHNMVKNILRGVKLKKIDVTKDKLVKVEKSRKTKKKTARRANMHNTIVGELVGVEQKTFEEEALKNPPEEVTKKKKNKVTEEQGGPGDIEDFGFGREKIGDLSIHRTPDVTTIHSVVLATLYALSIVQDSVLPLQKGQGQVVKLCIS